MTPRAAAVVFVGLAAGSVGTVLARQDARAPAGAPAPGSSVSPAPASSPLTPCELADADVLTLRARVLQLEAQLAAQGLETERVRLEARYRERLKPPADAVFDWQTKTFGAPKPSPAPGSSAPPAPPPTQPQP
jgi:hypothetical protein